MGQFECFKQRMNGCLPLKSILTGIGLLVGSQFVSGQTGLFVLHPAVGDTISQAEKRSYLLFEQVPDSAFGYGTIWLNDGSFQLKVEGKYGEQELELTMDEISSNQVKIEKLDKYYQWLVSQKADSVEQIVHLDDTLNSFNLNDDYISLKQRKKITREAKRFLQLSHSADDNGLIGADKERYIDKNGSFTIWYVEKWKGKLPE